MPPRKKAKRAHSTTPPEDTAANSSAETPGSSDSVAKPDEPEYDLLSDPWTDEQETALLKAVIKWKPVGVHKHFRMIAIYEYLKSQGYAPANAEHMRIPGIWKKLGTLYNLEALDERENALIKGDANDDEDQPSERFCSYEPPYDEYGDMMFERRLALEGSSSPISPHPESRRGSTVADTDEPRSSPAPSRGRKSNRGTRQAGRETRSTRLQVEIGTDSQGKPSDDDDAESGEESAANDEGEGEANEEDEAEEGSDGGMKESDGDEDDSESKGGSRSTRAQTSRFKQKEKKTSTNTGTRRTARRR
ncbi:hypothetical protein N7532_011538 [Penicillium argentinense]|uniref:Chromatin modification-related protein EAF7 n=1 Tax=Penicillium argentinense TaxID=1131581 RepID=A0A9W9EIT2_9EURO|nr:uncharacterized protein N7532_011538 [Penicillium argentinense]KAJ5082495.1 hypothetical protein N7532_011538 [Penicillium argentinense]